MELEEAGRGAPGEVGARVAVELEADYGSQPTYAVLARVFVEHFRVAAERLEVKRETN